MRALKIILVIIIMIVGLFLWSNLGANDTAPKIAQYPYYNSTSKVTGETLHDGSMYLVVETTTITTHLRVKESMKLNRYELKFLDK